jgi:hypothetical protein
MDDPPSTYNSNESVLSGGIDSSLQIKMVQGGGGDLNSYNETDSVLEGGITNANAPITQVQGGGGENDIQIISNYSLLDTKQYDAFVKTYSGPGRFSNAITKLEGIFKKGYTEKTLHYRKAGSYVETNSMNSRNTSNIIQIKFIPTTTKSLIILPPLKEPKDFVQQLMFLITNQYVRISSKKEFIIENNIFVISLGPFDSSELSKFFYYKLKVSNLYSYYRIDDPIEENRFVFVVHKEVEGKKGILIAKSGFNFLMPMKDDELTPIDYDLIQGDAISTMKYKGDPSKIYNNFNVISDGEDPSPIVTEYSFTLKNSIAILDLIDEDVQKIKVDINGESYRIRVPLSPNETLDKVYSAWNNGRYEGDEIKLINDLGLKNIEGLEIPRFLFHLSYFKCFDDMTLLTKQECSYMKNELQKVYYHSLKKRESKIRKISTTSDFDSRIIKDVICNTIDATKDASISNQTVVCKVTYIEGDGLEEKKTEVTIDNKYIGLLKSNKDKDIKSIEKAAEIEFRKQK